MGRKLLQGRKLIASYLLSSVERVHTNMLSGILFGML